MPYSTAAARVLPGDSQTDELAHAIRRTWYALVRDVVHGDKLEGLGRQGFWVLGALACEPKRMSDLADATDISSASLTGIVDRLAHRGLVTRERSTSDRRVVEVTITGAGLAELEDVHRQFTARLDAMLEPLSPAERDELLRLLGAMAS